MRLSELVIENFRSCSPCKVEFSPHVTVLVGENGTGKSNIVDAIRLTVTPVSGRRYSYIDERRDLTAECEIGTTISIRQTYKELTGHEKGVYIEKLADSEGNLVYTVDCDTRPGIPYRTRIVRYSGHGKVLDPDLQSTQRIGCVYLPPLRDAAREFDSADGGRLSEIMEAIATEEEEAEFIEIGNSSMEELSRSVLVDKTLTTIQTHLTQLTHPTRKQELAVGYRNQRIDRLARFLRLQMSETGFDPGDLSRAGLGYTNLLYIASVVLQLEEARDKDLTLVLVEEPEAHLHPQLQMVLLQYLFTRARRSDVEAPQDGFSGRIQVIVTTHSPNIASAVSTKDVVVVRNVRIPPEDGRPVSRTTATFGLKNRNLTDSQRRKVDRYLTVTRASLLFAQKIILVEGIAEALLLQQLAESCVFVPRSDEPRMVEEARLRREAFSAVSIISVDSVDFEPYLRLILGDSFCLTERVVVLTDNDDGGGIRRKEGYLESFQSESDAGILSVFVGDATLEADLLALRANEPILRACYLDVHRNSAGKWDRIVRNAPDATSDRARYFLDHMSTEREASDRLDFPKGEFAQLLAERLSTGDDGGDFEVPAYIRDGITRVVE